MIEKSTKGLQILEDTEFKKIATFIEKIDDAISFTSKIKRFEFTKF